MSDTILIGYGMGEASMNEASMNKASMNKKQEDRIEYVRQNIPIIIKLVGKYNKLIKENPETYREAKKLNLLIEDLAKKIVEYTV